MTPARPGILLRLLLALLTSLLPGLYFTLPGSAAFQSAAGAEITDIDASDFPNMAVRVAVHGENGAHAANLTASAFALAENGVPVPALSVSSVEVGVQIVFLIASDETFIKRDATGTSRYEYMRQSVSDFLVEQPGLHDGVDDVTILTPDGPLVLHSSVGIEANGHLSTYEPPTAPPPVDLLPQITNAVELAQPAGPGQGRSAAVVVYASGLSNTSEEDIDQAAAQARQLGVPVFAVNVSAPLEPEAVNATNLRRLAEGTGGQMVYFTSPDAVEPLFAAVSAQRMQYLLSYRSQLGVSGLPAITVLVRLPGGGEPVTSAPATFSLDVSPPEVGISGLAQSIRREMTQTPASGAAEPLTREVRVAVAFPDGHPREISRLQLLVDGEPAGEVTEPPFNSIIWDLAATDLAAGPHSISVQATDELGLTGVSAPIDVTITDVELAAAPQEEAPGASFQIPWLAIGGGVLALGLLGALALLLLRARPRLLAGLSALADRDEEGRRSAPTRAGSPAEALGDSQPVSMRDTEPFSVASLKAVTLDAAAADEPLAPVPRNAPRRAYLELLHVGEGARMPIELSGRPVTLGRDPALASITFADRSVSRLHARVETDEEGEFHIYDEGSTSGTWVNYEQVSAAGRILQHGDLVNLGRVQLRFRLRPVEAPPGRATGGPDNGSVAGRLPEDSTIPFKPKRRRWGGFR